MFEIKVIVVGMNFCGIVVGVREIYEVIKVELEKRNFNIKFKIVGCVGMCYCEFFVDIIIEDEIIIYGYVDLKKVLRIIEEYVINGRFIKEWIVKCDWWENGERKMWDVDGYFVK